MPEKTDYVVGFYLASGRDVLAIRKNKPAWQRGKLNAPGGHVEPWETFAEAMVREFHEETDVYVAEGRWTHFCTLQGPTFEVRFYFTEVQKDDSPARTMTDEEILWISRDQLMAWGIPNLRWIMPMMHPELAEDWPFKVERADVRDEIDR